MEEAVRQIEFERTYDAPMVSVWQAWTEPEKLKKWWGPDNVIVPECEIELKVGGRFYLVMEATEGMGDFKGTRWPMEATFTEIDEPTRLVYAAKAWTEGQQEGTEIEQVSELTLREAGGTTVLHLKVTISKTGPGAKMAVEGMKWGYNQQFDRLQDYLAA